jgi:bifunctional DNA-binding transcriptional regulator/antitoxin component of YhaV-PrlF toxin-antitoxin module
MEKNELGLRKHIGIGHGDKIHVEDRNTGGHSILAKLSSKMSTDSPIMSLSAERRHEVQRGVEAREAELKEMHSNILDMIRKRAKRKPITSPQSSKNLSPNKIEPTISHGSPEKLPPPIPNLFNTAPEKQGVHTDDVADLQEQARLVESQNQYLEIPYDSIRILGGKENELGCGKAAAVYRGLWMSQNGAAEVC